MVQIWKALTFQVVWNSFRSGVITVHPVKCASVFLALFR